MIILKAIAQCGHYVRIYLCLLDCPIAIQWGGHELIANLRSPNKKMLGMHIVFVLGQKQYVSKFQSHHSKPVGPREGKSPTGITSDDLF